MVVGDEVECTVGPVGALVASHDGDEVEGDIDGEGPVLKPDGREH